MRFVAGQVGAGGLAHEGAGRFAGIIVGRHGGHDFVPGTGEGFAEIRVGVEGFCVNDHQVDDLARNFRRVEHLVAVRHVGDFAEQRIPGRHGSDVITGIGRNQISVGGVHHGQVFFTEAHAFQSPCQHVVRNRELHQVHVLALYVSQCVSAFQHNAVIAVGEIADDKSRGIHAAGGGNGQGVHVGHGATVVGAGGVLVDGFHVVVDLHHVDVDVVLVGPFIHDFLLGAVIPRHPAHIDGPADAEGIFSQRGDRHE